MTSPLPKWSSEDDRHCRATYLRKVLAIFGTARWYCFCGRCSYGFQACCFSRQHGGLPVALLVAVLGIAPALTGMMAMVGRSAKGYFMRLGDAWRGMAAPVLAQCGADASAGAVIDADLCFV